MEPEPWIAPAANGPLTGSVSVPGSKSLTNRSLVLAAISNAPSRLVNVLVSRDSDLMIQAMRALGTRIDSSSSGELVVTPMQATAARDEESPVRIDCGLAGTVMRFAPPTAATSHGRFGFDGDEEARSRPMGPLMSALEQLGVKLDNAEDGSLPFELHANGTVVNRNATIDSSASSQFVSSLLLAAARFDHGIDLSHQGPPIPSLPHIEMTVAMLRQQGVDVSAETTDPTKARWLVAPGPISATDRVIEPDLSNAMPFVAAVIVAGGSVTIRGLSADSLQPTDRVAEIFSALGASIRFEGGNLVAIGTGKPSGLKANLADIGELVPTIAALCALADSESILAGVGHLTGHETDRLAALASEINAMGGDVQVMDSGLRIRPRPLRPSGLWHTYHDHRMATAGAILGLAIPRVVVENIATTGKTFPDFPSVWQNFINPSHGSDEPGPDAS